ncbi:MAG: hypothetical protein U9N84_05135 [Actinomycetota bacterium]|nr:hypothetical protein [Actinomycetota bacterium]
MLTTDAGDVCIVSERERISHVLGRLGFGSQPELIDAVGTVDETTALALDLSERSQVAPQLESPAVTRRQFLSTIGASVAVASAGAYGISVWGRNPDGTGIPTAVGTTSTTSTTSAPLPAGTFEAIGDRTLVVIEVGDGSDGLNMVVPHADARYHDLRGDLAVSAPIDLDGEIGLHPASSFVAERYRNGQVAIVEGVGYPDPDLSHLASMANWWSG